ncbi:cupin domain-containing protein [Synechococcus sp. PCC 7502]|uniref:cupin domain-containing protein n=1 Tax=Synechococcus sp. PCC 7502 TaxID=1173263 RepID=UPI00029FE206|nr:cupin domain-containing protein [Synechococcus sp. PCC 7502]AFY74891.1 cupin domain-containing protein [Synechococcus sp. PCC 7502]
MTHEDFIELASLYVIGALDERDRSLVENCAEDSRVWKTELDKLQMAALAIPYASEPYPLPSGLKERVLQKINSEHPTEKPIGTSDIAAEQLSFQVKASDLKWYPHPDQVPGVSIASLHVDQTRSRFSGLVRCQPGTIYPAHRHAEAEEIYILEGDLIIDGDCFAAGDYIYCAPNSIHTPITNRNGCLFWVTTSLDDQFL